VMTKLFSFFRSMFFGRTEAQRCLDEQTIKALKYQAGTATLFIADGLEIYVRMKGWGDRAKDLPPSESQMRAMGEVPTRLMPEDAKEG
jgi:hypothetical protein